MKTNYLYKILKFFAIFICFTCMRTASSQDAFHISSIVISPPSPIFIRSIDDCTNYERKATDALSEVEAQHKVCLAQHSRDTVPGEDSENACSKKECQRIHNQMLKIRSEKTSNSAQCRAKVALIESRENESRAEEVERLEKKKKREAERGEK